MTRIGPLLFAWLLFPCAAALWRRRRHFTVDPFEQTIPSATARRALAIVVAALCLMFLAALFRQACAFVEASATETSPVFGVSRVYWYGVMPLAAGLMIAYSVARRVALAKAKDLFLT
jgi:TRAP-type C4-dicarboxylate transport system permease small subunit